MYTTNSRLSWNTNVKHYVRNGLFDNLPEDLKIRIPKTNKHRWASESESKYIGDEIAAFIKEELEMIKRIGESSNGKKVMDAYFTLSDTYHTIIGDVKGIQTQIASQKDLIVNAIEKVKTIIPVNEALKVFNISMATYQNYKTLVLNKCDSSHFLWCVKHYPQQLLKKEIFQIKTYMENEAYQYWSKSSVYLLAVRNKDISFCLATFYKYCKLLGYKSSRHLQRKIKYASLKSFRPNEIWCADVTIVKTADNEKHYVHFLMDHFSKKILGYKVESSSKPSAIKELLLEAYQKYKNPQPITFLTDGGCENINTTVQDFLKTTNQDIKHLIAQKDIPFSNSTIEAFNKIMKHQFLIPKNLSNRKHLVTALATDVPSYNGIRPQLSLKGNTPDETFDGKSITILHYNTHFKDQKELRKTENQQNSCKKCL